MLNSVDRTNPILAMFASAVVMIAPDQRDAVFASISGLAANPHFNDMMADTSASSDGFWPDPESWRAAYRPYVIHDGILHIPVRGMLLHEFPWAVGTWATGYEYIWRAFQRGCEDFKAGNIKGIALIVNSPGGFVSGCWDAVDKMSAAKAEYGVPVRAIVNEHAYSAAYGHATVADTIVVARTGGAGSIGTVRTHVDWSKWNEQRGLTYTFIEEGEFKTDGHPDKPLSAAAQKRWSKQIRELNEIFVSTVARNRGLDPQVIRDFEAATFSASEAVSNGLADSIGSFDDALAAYAADLSNSEGDDEMSNQDTAAQSAAHEAALATARTDAKAEGIQEGAAAERTRITTILGSDEAKDRPTAALALALKGGMDATATIGVLADMPEEPKAAAPATEPKGAGAPAGMFQAAMDGSLNPDLSDTGATEMSAEDVALAQSRPHAPRKAA